MSKIEQLILSKGFPYLQPYFYNHPYALRCELGRGKTLEISLVSFANECILSVCDHRGCDIVFSDHASMMRFYARLEPYFLARSVEEMARRAAAAP